MTFFLPLPSSLIKLLLAEFGGGVNVNVDISLQKRQCFDGIKQLFDIAGIFFSEKVTSCLHVGELTCSVIVMSILSCFSQKR